ncbi:ankyrin repeat, PH and SEC7 domain containing protein secG-like [Liolophura sinensis]|uniref:ankyrin repeat, PH and SEC7 domain containing protein secG-like n=1 Tax=Liolophura sinensis TaxID=3198878 RepID=UPI00315806B6
MGAKSSNLNWFDHQLSLQKPPGKYKSRCYNLSPPSYNHNWTDLHYAASHGNVRWIQEILHKSGTVNLNKKDYYGKTPLYWAAYKGHKSCMEELLKFGAIVNTRCCHGGTPLHTVVSIYPDCAALLIKHGADVNCSDNWGVTPMYLAASSGLLLVVHFLIVAGAKLTYRNKKTGELPKQLSGYKGFCQYLTALSRNPSTLQQQCRVVIRRHIGEHPIPKIKQLCLPRQLKEDLMLADLDIKGLPIDEY